MSNLSRRSFLRTGLAGGATLAVSTVSTAALAAKPAKGLYRGRLREGAESYAKALASDILR